MGSEFRTIVLTEEEIESAVKQQVAAQPGKTMDPSAIAAVTLRPSPKGPESCRCLVRFNEPRLDGAEEVILEADELVEALIAFCRARGVPLPRNGRKRLGRVNGNLALMIELDWF